MPSVPRVTQLCAYRRPYDVTSAHRLGLWTRHDRSRDRPGLRFVRKAGDRHRRLRWNGPGNHQSAGFGRRDGRSSSARPERGHFQLTVRLWPALRRAGGARLQTEHSPTLIDRRRSMDRKRVSGNSGHRSRLRHAQGPAKTRRRPARRPETLLDLPVAQRLQLDVTRQASGDAAIAAAARPAPQWAQLDGSAAGGTLIAYFRWSVADQPPMSF